MLEILSHQYLKRFIKSYKADWDNIYSFGRLISKCIQTNDNYLINSEIFYKNSWFPALLISLFLNTENSTFVLSSEKIEFFKKHIMKDLKKIGFDFFFKNDQIIFPKHRISLITLERLVDDFNYYGFENHRIILTGIENIRIDLKDYFRISLSKEDWIDHINRSSNLNHKNIQIYNSLKKKFFLRKVIGNNYLILNRNEISFFCKFFSENRSFSNLFSRVNFSLKNGWACWVKLDEENFEWNFYLEPIDEIFEIKKLLSSNKFIFLSAMRKDIFFQKFLKRQNINIDVVVNLKSNFDEKKILIYTPPKQMLPNNPKFTQEILNNCKKLIIFRSGLTLVLSDDADLKIRIATELAAIYGKRVLLEEIPQSNNNILCSSYNWWIKNFFLIAVPDQIIIPLLPIPNMAEPINDLTISYNQKLSRDWFREFLLPEAIEKLERSVSPLRRNSGKLIILDGRANKRKWGRSLLQLIKPSKHINDMLPFD